MPFFTEKNWWTVIVTSLASIIILFVFAKIMGKRQISQLSLFDYINGITLGSIAGELATMTNDSFIRPLIAMIMYAAAAVGFSLLANKSILFRRFIDGIPLILFDQQKIYMNNLRRTKIDLNEFLTTLRSKGYFDLADVQTAILETNGEISVLPKSQNRPVTPKDMRLRTRDAWLVINIIIDGNVMENNLKQSGKNRPWLDGQLNKQNMKLQDCMLGTIDNSGVFTAYGDAKTDKQKSVFM